MIPAATPPALAESLLHLAPASEGTGDTDQPIVLSEQLVEGSGTENLSSPKYTQPLLDVPQTVAVIPPEVYQAQAAATLTDALRNTPGITLFAGEGGSANRTGGDSFYLRGFDTSNSIFVDGVRDEGQGTHDLFDIGQVEVFKGPSPENGRGGTAGYVNLETKLPQLAPLAEAIATFEPGSDGSRASDRITADVDQPLAPAGQGGMAMRLNLMDQEGGVPGREIAEQNRWGVAPGFAWGLGSPTEVDLSYLHQYEHNLPDYGLPATVVAGLAPPAAAGAPSYFSPGVDPGTYYGFANLDYEHITADAVTARAEHTFSAAVSVDNQLRYDATDRIAETTAPSGSTTAAPPGEASLTQGIYQTRNTILEDQVNAIANFVTGVLTHALTAGLELSRERAEVPAWSLVPYGQPAPAYLVGVYDPLNFPASLPNYDPHQTGAGTYTRIDTGALYAFDTAKLGSHWELTGGLRLERYVLGENSATISAPAIAAASAAAGSPGTPGTAATAAAAAVPASDVSLGAAHTSLTGKAGLVYKPVESGSLYVSFANSVRPPGTSSSANTLSTTTTSADNPALAPEETSDVEAGVKWGLFEHDALEVSFAAFQMVNDNVPATDPVSGAVIQTSDQTVRGLEWGVSGKVTPQWEIFGGFSAMNSQVSNLLVTNAQGLTLPLLPHVSGNLWNTYAVSRRFSLGAGVQYEGATERLQATSAPTTTTFSNQVPAFWLANAMASYALNRQVTLQLNVNNLFNREYIASLNNNGYRVNLGAPRTVLLTLRWKL